MNSWRWALHVGLGLVLTGCGSGSGEGLDASGQPTNGTTPTPLVAEFSSIQQNVFTPICTVCHAGASAPLGLRLDAANSYAALVNVASVQAPGQQRVNPGNPDSSYLIAKIEGRATVGAQMPLGGPALPPATIAVIRQWITAGAPPATTIPPPANTAPTVVSSTPASGATLTALPASINVAFSHEMNPASLSNTSVVLRRSGGDGNFSNGNEVTVTPASLSLSAANPALLTISLSGVASADDSYELRLVGTGATPLRDLNSNALDGDGDGTAGGDHLVGFVVRSTSTGLQPTWRSIQDNVFTPVCTVCHAGAGAPEGLSLDEANSYAMLVNVASQQVPSIQRVLPNNANNSYLIQKLEGTATEGSQMPRGGPPLPQATIDIIRQWIDAGAPQGGSQPPPPSNTTVDVSLTAPSNTTRGDEFTVSATLQNNGNAAINNLTLSLTWTPQDALRIRSGQATQTVATLGIGQSVTVSWILRGDSTGSASITATVTDSNSQSIGSGTSTIAINN